ncbi:unnamed protein product [Parnassius apollo]|uniref:(apollo) hypothetical protein n=1 Tax=Parnassius apollo TaxID=110799 RepID=A0A8S3WM53_PARAO|nr:unnamed protein product [Parnassius apollo]
MLQDNQTDNRIGQTERVILSPLPSENNKLLDAEDPLNQEVHDYCSDDSVKDPNYVNTDDYYFDFDHSDLNSKKRAKRFKRNKFAENIDPMISVATKNSSSSQISTPNSHQKINYSNKPKPGPSKISYIPKSSSSSSSSSSDSSDSSSSSSDSSDTEENAKRVEEQVTEPDTEKNTEMDREPDRE